MTDPAHSSDAPRFAYAPSTVSARKRGASPCARRPVATSDAAAVPALVVTPGAGREQGRSARLRGPTSGPGTGVPLRPRPIRAPQGPTSVTSAAPTAWKMGNGSPWERSSVTVASTFAAPGTRVLGDGRPVLVHGCRAPSHSAGLPPMP